MKTNDWKWLIAPLRPSEGRAEHGPPHEHEGERTAALTAFLFLDIQQLEGNVLTPRIQAQTIKVPHRIPWVALTIPREDGSGLSEASLSS